MPKEKVPSKFPYIITIILLILLIGSVRSLIDLNSSSKKIAEVKSEIERLSQDNSKLREDIEFVQTEEYIEQAALEQLRLTKPGYRILVINEKTPEDVNPDMYPSQEKRDYANWEQWAVEFGLEEFLP